MKRKILLLCVFLYPFFLLAQEEQDSTAVEMERLSGDFEIGQSFNFGETSVSFLKVLADSRCPRQVTCIWPGEAIVLVGIERNGKYSEEEIVVSGSGIEIPLTDELLLQFSHLRPYPETSVKIAPEEYCLRFSALFPAEG